MNTNQKRPRTSWLLRRVAARGPMLSSRITGVVSDHRVYSHTPGITSRPVAMVVMEGEINAAARTLGTKGAASIRSSSTLRKPGRWTPRCALLTTPSAYARYS
jgi:hypothetical protein